MHKKLPCYCLQCRIHGQSVLVAYLEKKNVASYVYFYFSLFLGGARCALLTTIWQQKYVLKELNLKKDQGVFRAKPVDVALMTTNSNITTRSKTILCNLYEQRLS